MNRAKNYRWMGWISLVAMSVSLAGAAPFQQDAKPAGAPRAGTSVQLPDGAMKQAATASCTECHDATIIVQQRLSKAAWVKEVDKMIKWGADVDANDHDPLVNYLSTNFSPDKPPYEPAKTAPEKNAK